MNKPKILLPVHPEWCEKIFNGSKTIEVRKSAPKIDTPFEVLVYCTKAKNIREDGLYLLPNDRQWYLGCEEKDLSFVREEGDFRNGKVIGSFVCDKIDKYTFSSYEAQYRINDVDLMRICLNHPELNSYGKGKPLYGWHITEPKLFYYPRELSEYAFFGKCAEECDEYDFCARDYVDGRMSCKYFKRKYLTRAPQSWIYVESV